jgi:hypothetical protein
MNFVKSIGKDLPKTIDSYRCSASQGNVQGSERLAGMLRDEDRAAKDEAGNGWK